VGWGELFGSLVIEVRKESVMPRFHLHIRENARFIEDPEGAEFSSIEEARAVALKSAKEMWSDFLLNGRDPNTYAFEITDGMGQIVVIVPFAAASEDLKNR
jgi:hypothetical protein